MWDAVVSCSDTAELFELSDGAFDAVSELVFDRIEGAFAGHAAALGDDRLRASCLDKVEDCVGVVGFVGQNMVRIAGMLAAEVG